MISNQNLSPREALSTVIEFSMGRTLADASTSKPVKKAWNVAQLLKWFTTFVETDSKVGVVNSITPAIFSGDKRLKNDGISAQIMCFDFDGDPLQEEWDAYVAGGKAKGAKPKGKGEPDSWIKNKLDELEALGIDYAAHTSFSHAKHSLPDHSRFRVSIFLDRKIKDADEFLSVWLFFANFFEGRCDFAPQAWNAIFHGPCHPVGSTRHWSRMFFRGSLASVDEAAKIGRLLQKDTVMHRMTSKSDPKLASFRVTGPQKTERDIRVTNWVRERADYTRGNHLPADTMLDTGKGLVRALSLPKGGKVSCKAPWREDNNPSGWAKELNGRVRVFDSGTREWRFVEGWADYYLAGIFSDLSSIDEKDASFDGRWSLRDGAIVLPASTSEYLSDQLPADPRELCPGAKKIVILCRAEMGVGKTQLAVKWAESLNGPTLNIVDSIALAASAAKNFATDLYDNPDIGDLPERLTSTTHSLHRFAAGENRWSFVVADEVPSIMSAWHSPIMKGQGQRAKDAFFAHLSCAEVALCISADLSDEHMDYIEKCLKERDPEITVIRIVRPPVPGRRKVALYKSLTWKRDLIEDVKDHVAGSLEPLVIQVTSTEAPEKMAEEFRNLRPDLKYWCVSSLNSADLAESLKDPNALIRDYDVIIASPTVKAGLSWDLPVRRVYASFTVPELVSRDLTQMLMRVRAPKDATLRVTIKGCNKEWDTDPNYIRRMILGLAQKTKDEVENLMVQYRTNPRTGERIALDPEYADSAIMMIRELRLCQNDYVRSFVQACNACGWEVEDRREIEIDQDEHSAILKAQKEASDVVKAEYVGAVVSSPDLTAEEYVAVKAKKVGLSRTDKNSIEKHEIREFYGRIDTDLVSLDKKGKKRKEIRSVVDLLVYQNITTEIGVWADAARIYGRDGFGEQKDATEWKHHNMRLKLQDVIIRKAFGCSLTEAKGKEFSIANLAELGQWLGDVNNRRLVREVLKTSCTESSAERPTQWLCAFLKNLGVKTRTSKRQVEGETIRFYTIDLTGIATLGELQIERTLRFIDEMRRDNTAPFGTFDFETLQLAA